VEPLIIQRPVDEPPSVARGGDGADPRTGETDRGVSQKPGLSLLDEQDSRDPGDDASRRGRYRQDLRGAIVPDPAKAAATLELIEDQNGACSGRCDRGSGEEGHFPEDDPFRGNEQQLLGLLPRRSALLPHPQAPIGTGNQIEWNPDAVLFRDEEVAVQPHDPPPVPIDGPVRDRRGGTGWG
jgi:hypothetical protein